MTVAGLARLDWDRNATRPLREEVRAQLLAALSGPHGNPSSVHAEGRAARRRLEAARAQVAQVLACTPREVSFTASGSEANALALQGAWLARAPGKSRVVLSSIEHPSLLTAADTLQLLGAQVVRVPPSPDGRVDAQRFLAEVDEQTAVASLMWANNETGVVQPVDVVARACRARGVTFHTDAVQAAGRLPLNLLQVDAALVSLSGHKLGAPVGSGALVVRSGTPLRSVVPGHQEDGVRGGTQAVWLAEAFALALELGDGEARASNPLQQASVRDAFERGVREAIADVEVTGQAAPRLPDVSHLRFLGADAEAVLIGLDLAGIAASAGAACASGTLAPSHVLLAMGQTPAEARQSVRFSLPASATPEDAQRVIAALVQLVPRARAAARAMA